MKKLLLFVALLISMFSYGQTDIENIPEKVKKEYIIFDINKFENDYNNLDAFEMSLLVFKNKIKDKINEEGMKQYALEIINYDKIITHSILGEDEAEYQNALKELTEKTQNGEATPELEHIIMENYKKVQTKLSQLEIIKKSYGQELKQKRTEEDFLEIIKDCGEETKQILNEYISREILEEINPVYAEALQKKKRIEREALLPHLSYSGSYGTSGYAKYTYKEPEDGERIYDGKWYYKEGSGLFNITFTSEGQYKNDIRVGKWIWTYKSKHVLNIYTLNFDENGYLHGEASFSELGRNTKRVYFNHGRVVGKYTNFWDPQNSGYINIEFDQSSVVVGTATFKAKYVPNTYMKPVLYTETYENGELKSRLAKNYQTGDKMNWGIDIRKSFFDAVYKIVLNGTSHWPSIIDHSPDRKSPHIDIYN